VDEYSWFLASGTYIHSTVSNYVFPLKTEMLYADQHTLYYLHMMFLVRVFRRKVLPNMRCKQD